jgi:predicted secreted protein
VIPVKNVGFSEDGQSVILGREGEENVRVMYPPNVSSRVMGETGLSGAVWILRRER